MAELGVWGTMERARLVRLCATISGDRDAAEDLAQETLLEAWRHRHKLVDPSGSDRWLSAIARHVCSRWARARGRLPVPAADLPEPVAPPEDGIVELLELLPPDAREPMVQRFVYERSHGEIAAALGISEDAVAMRLTRGKHTLRQLLAQAEWRPSRHRCPQCGTRTLLMRRSSTEIAFTCPACTSREILSRYPLENPHFARLVGGLERPSAMFRHVGEWAIEYFGGGDGTSVPCTRCSHPVTVRAHRRDGTLPGLFVRCGSCGEEVWCALAGITAGLPAVRELRSRRLTEIREERGAVEIVQRSVDGAGSVTVAFDRTTFALLGTT